MQKNQNNINKKKILYKNTKHCKNYKYQITFFLFIYFKTLKDINNWRYKEALKHQNLTWIKIFKNASQITLIFGFIKFLYFLFW
jgi:hypothetical protein